jgi:glycosyltransferase involved in cell wall biosynthesis
MKIAIVCQPWDPVGPTDGGNSISIIAYQFARHLARCHRVALYGRRMPGESRGETDAAGVEYRRIKVARKPYRLYETLLAVLLPSWPGRLNPVGSRFYHLRYAFAVAADIRRHGADLVLIVNFAQFAPVIRLLNPDAAIVLHMECEWLTQLGERRVGRALRSVDLVLGCSDHVTRKVRAAYPQLAERCQTVHNGVDTSLFSPGEPRSPARPERLLLAARISPEKGIHILLDAMARLVARGRDLRLDLVGATTLLPFLYGVALDDTPDGAALACFYGMTLLDRIGRQLFDRKGKRYLAEALARLPKAAADRVSHHGLLSHTQLLELYRTATVFVFPSVWDEPFGMPVIEAMACGCPVIATRSGGLSEIIREGQTGLLVAKGNAADLADALQHLLDDPDARAAFAAEGCRRAVQDFSWEAVSMRLQLILEELHKARAGLSATRAPHPDAPPAKPA